MIRPRSIAPAPLKAAARWAADRLPLARKPSVLMYHRIGDDAFDPWGLAVREALFEEQLDWLARNRDVMPLSELARQHSEGRLPSDAISITFDDGYADTVETAIGLLEKYGLTATVFVPLGVIERGHAFWWDELAGIVLGYRGENLRFDGKILAVPRAEGGDRVWRPGAAPATPRQRLFDRMRRTLRSQTPGAIETAMADLREQFPLDIACADRPLSLERLRSIPSQTIELGSHALNHPCLTSLDPDDQAREINDSRTRFASLTGSAPTTFAYPFGEYDASIIAAVKKAGFDCAVTSDRGFVSSRSNPFALPRLRVGNRRFR